MMKGERKNERKKMDDGSFLGFRDHLRRLAHFLSILLHLPSYLPHTHSHYFYSLSSSVRFLLHFTIISILIIVIIICFFFLCLLPFLLVLVVVVVLFHLLIFPLLLYSLPPCHLFLLPFIYYIPCFFHYSRSHFSSALHLISPFAIQYFLPRLFFLSLTFNHSESV